MVSAPIPKNVQELHPFLGLLNYYWKFLPNLASLLQPLNSLLQQGCNMKWTPECTKAFLVLSAKVLGHYDPMLPLKLAADASSYGPGAVITHFSRWIRTPYCFYV